MADALRVRRNIEDLQSEYESGNKKPLEDLMRAWKGIKEMHPDAYNSFFLIGGYHGEPFRGAGWGTSAYWGGYCNHGNVLFPTWHRFYMLRIEDALRSIAGCEDVTLPFWDEASESSKRHGIPWALTRQTFELDGKTIPNPLRSFVFNKAIQDQVSDNGSVDYSKPKHYETVRYPLSGLVGTANLETTKAHNALYPDPEANVALLDKNVVNWLTASVEIPKADGTATRVEANIAKKFADCLDAPNYTLFSNTTSAAEWNQNVPEHGRIVVPIESPHNDVHLAVGGCDIPAFDQSPIAGANGDMGENDTASFDPIFYFHHCFIDRVFWLWQKRHGATDALEIIEHYPGTNSVDSQGPTPGVAPNSWLDLDSPLQPFAKPGGGFHTSRDCINIEKQLGYTYGPGSLEDLPDPHHATAQKAAHRIRHVQVSGINRAMIPGSFTISAFAVVSGRKLHLGTESVLSRWHVEGCANCQAHLHARATFPLEGFDEDTLRSAPIAVEVHTRGGKLDRHRTIALPTGETVVKPRYRFEVR